MNQLRPPEIERKALYNMMRFNWLEEQHAPTPSADPKPAAWQIADYRSFSTETLFAELAKLSIRLDQATFLSFAEEVDSPEELVETVAAEISSADQQDQIFLLLFELWRRFLPEKQSLSLLCDALDQQIWLYDHDQPSDQIAPLLQRLLEVLEENCEENDEPQDVFASLLIYCANDLETFLYDYLSECLEKGQFAYVAEMIEGFSLFVLDPKWLELLQARLSAREHPQEASQLMRALFNHVGNEPDLQFYLEMLLALSLMDDPELFIATARKAAILVHKESDFQDLLLLCAEFSHASEMENQQAALEHILEGRKDKPLDGTILSSDPDFIAFTHVMS